MPRRFLAKAEIRDWWVVGKIAAAIGCVKVPIFLYTIS
jgi:1-acyl-sn-glycerol-3-phosphate acyltransferase